MNKIIENFGLKVDSIKTIGNSIILTTSNNKCVLKKCNNDYYEYLNTRNFNYFPDVINKKDNYLLEKYISNKELPINQRIEDMVYLISLLHKSTSYYKKIDLDTIKEKYEKIVDECEELNKYYLSLQDMIEDEEYMSPANYLLVRNVSTIYYSLKLSREYLDKWYSLIKNKQIIRYSYIHNNLSLGHILEDDKPYLISWNKSKIDIPIYDIVDLYKKNYRYIKLEVLLDIYSNKYLLSTDEIYLLFSILLIPSKIDMNLKEYLRVVDISNMVLYLKDTINSLKSYTIDHNKKIDKEQEY